MPLNSFIIGASGTSIGSFIRYCCACKNISKGCCRAVVCLIIEVITVIVLAAIYQRQNLASANLNSALIANLVVYVLFNIIKELSKGWSFSGIVVNQQCIRINYINAVHRIIQRIVAAVCVLIIMFNYYSDFLALFPYNSALVAKAIYPFL